MEWTLSVVGPVNMCECVHVCACNCLPLPSNQSFYRLIASYWMGVNDHEVPRGQKGIMGKQISYMTLIGMHLTMHLMHPN